MKTHATHAHEPETRVSPWPALALLLVAISYRVFLAWLTVGGDAAAAPAWMLNFTPLAALALAGGCFLPRPWNMAVPLGALLASDLVINALYGEGPGTVQTLGRYACLIVMIAVGAGLQRGLGSGRLNAPAGATALLAASVGGSTLFYLVTNTLSWLGSPDYAQSLAGWTQALTTGVPGYPPTWVFFRNALVSDLLVTGALAAVCLPWSSPSSARVRGRRPSLPSPAGASAPV